MIPIPGTVYLLAAAFVAGAVATYKVMDWAHDAEKLREVEAARLVERSNARAVVRVEKEVVERIIRIKERGETITKEVKVYVTAKDDSGCVLPVGYVRVHDAAVRNENPGPPAERDRTASGVALSRAGELQTENYQAYHVVREQLRGCVSAYEAVRQCLNLGRCPEGKE